MKEKIRQIFNSMKPDIGLGNKGYKHVMKYGHLFGNDFWNSNYGEFHQSWKNTLRDEDELSMSLNDNKCLGNIMVYKRDPCEACICNANVMHCRKLHCKDSKSYF